MVLIAYQLEMVNTGVKVTKSIIICRVETNAIYYYRVDFGFCFIKFSPTFQKLNKNVTKRVEQFGVLLKMGLIGTQFLIHCHFKSKSEFFH